MAIEINVTEGNTLGEDLGLSKERSDKLITHVFDAAMSDEEQVSLNFKELASKCETIEEYTFAIFCYGKLIAELTNQAEQGGGIMVVELTRG
jgi:hypothetical protein